MESALSCSRLFKERHATAYKSTPLALLIGLTIHTYIYICTVARRCQARRYWIPWTPMRNGVSATRQAVSVCWMSCTKRTSVAVRLDHYTSYRGMIVQVNTCMPLSFQMSLPLNKQQQTQATDHEKPKAASQTSSSSLWTCDVCCGGWVWSAGCSGESGVTPG